MQETSRPWSLRCCSSDGSCWNKQVDRRRPTWSNRVGLGPKHSFQLGDNTCRSNAGPLLLGSACRVSFRQMATAPWTIMRSVFHYCAWSRIGHFNHTCDCWGKQKDLAQGCSIFPLIIVLFLVRSFTPLEIMFAMSNRDEGIWYIRNKSVLSYLYILSDSAPGGNP